MTTGDPIKTARCRTCGGVLTTANALGRDEFTHLYSEDWVNNVHPARAGRSAGGQDGNS
jgi:hypothetical protein